jgi:DedD protein
MDRRVKERLVGASILVVLVVLIVPELLSGPPAPAPSRAGAGLPVGAPEPVRNVTVDLATSKAPTPEPAAEAPASSAEKPQPQPRSADSASAVEGGADSSAGNDAPSAAAPPRTPSTDALETDVPAPMSVPAAKPAAAGRTWAVQLGSFASRANADKLVRQLKSQGFSVYVAQGGSGRSLRYRVRIGPMADRGAATQTMAKLKSAGQTASLVPPAP